MARHRGTVTPKPGKSSGRRTVYHDPETGKAESLRTLSRRYAVQYETLRQRLNRGWPLEKALGLDDNGLPDAPEPEGGWWSIDLHDTSIPCQTRFNAAQARQRHRTCDTCGETKRVTLHNFSPSRRSDDGITTTCRSCYGRSGVARQAAMQPGRHNLPRPKRATELWYPLPPEPWYVPGQQADKYWSAIREARDWLLDNRQKTDKASREQRKGYLKMLFAATRLQTDPGNWIIAQGVSTREAMPYGQQHDELLAFLTFVEVLAPHIQGHVELGPIHTEAILPALLDDHPQSLILASRNSAKSTLCQLFVTWLLHRDPQLTVTVFSRSDQAAKRFVRTVRNWLRTPLLAYLDPDSEDADDVEGIIDTALGFTLPQAVGHIGASLSLSCFGITSSSITGSRTHVAILDDIESASDGRSDLKRDELLERAEEVFHLLQPPTRERVMSGQVIALGTPQIGAGRSIYAIWSTTNGFYADPDTAAPGEAQGMWKVTKARLFREHEAESGQTELESLWPQRFDEHWLAQQRKRLSRRQWSLHWQIDLGEGTDDDEKPFKFAETLVFDWSPESVRFPKFIKPGGERLRHLGPFPALTSVDGLFGPRSHSEETARYAATLATVDPASGLAKRDATGLCIIGVTADGKAVVRFLSGIRGASANETLVNTAIVLERFRPQQIVVESSRESLFPNNLETELIKRGFRTPVDTTVSRGRKADRIADAVGSVLAGGRLIFLEDVFRQNDAEEVVHQFVDFTYSLKELANDDIIDALAWSLRIASDRGLLLTDPAEAYETYSEERLQELLKLPKRQGGLDPDDPEVELLFGDHRAETEVTRRRLDNAREDNEIHLQRHGRPDPALERYIRELEAELRQFNGYAA